MEKIPKQFYTTEFKEEAVKLVTDGGLRVADVSRRLSVSPQTLRNWIKRHKDGKPVGGARTVSDLDAEVSRLRRELAEARLEKEILKKAMAYLAKEPRGGMR
jgi:transposase